MKDILPWLPYLAIDFLENWLHKSFEVFEWGSGLSTFYFSERVKSVISIEHNNDFILENKPENVKQIIVPPELIELGNDPSNPLHYRARPLANYNFKKYAESIEYFGLFDIIFIDGRARASCLYHSFKHLKEGGFIIIDNTERDYYLKNFDLNEWESIKFFGYGPENSWPWETTFLTNLYKS